MIVNKCNCCRIQIFWKKLDFLRKLFEHIWQRFYNPEARNNPDYFHTIFYLMMSASGMIEVQSSVLTCKGRIDLVVQFPKTVYIIKFKCNQSAEIALQQIKDKKYVEKYRDSGKKILLMGINFNKEQRNLEEWKVFAD